MVCALMYFESLHKVHTLIVLGVTGLLSVVLLTFFFCVYRKTVRVQCSARWHNDSWRAAELTLLSVQL